MTRTVCFVALSLLLSSAARAAEVPPAAEKDDAATLESKVQAVSESTDVKVNNLRIMPECRPDSQGLVRWEVTLAPKEKRELRLEYTVEYPTEWANAIREQFKAGTKSKVKLEEQIFEFESKF
jgi:hypothetical protein